MLNIRGKGLQSARSSLAACTKDVMSSASHTAWRIVAPSNPKGHKLQVHKEGGIGVSVVGIVLTVFGWNTTFYLGTWTPGVAKSSKKAAGTGSKLHVDPMGTCAWNTPLSQAGEGFAPDSRCILRLLGPPPSH